eukprot:m.131266 g.131266  ORF g.131266 m.131266 type:complete len:485 (+) comp13071_c7_seq1:302-1756(+)
MEFSPIFFPQSLVPEPNSNGNNNCSGITEEEEAFFNSILNGDNTADDDYKKTATPSVEIKTSEERKAVAKQGKRGRLAFSSPSQSTFSSPPPSSRMTKSTNQGHIYMVKDCITPFIGNDEDNVGYDIGGSKHDLEKTPSSHLKRFVNLHHTGETVNFSATSLLSQTTQQGEDAPLNINNTNGSNTKHQQGSIAAFVVDGIFTCASSNRFRSEVTISTQKGRKTSAARILHNKGRVWNVKLDINASIVKFFHNDEEKYAIYCLPNNSTNLEDATILRLFRRNMSSARFGETIDLTKGKDCICALPYRKFRHANWRFLIAIRGRQGNVAWICSRNSFFLGDDIEEGCMRKSRKAPLSSALEGRNVFPFSVGCSMNSFKVLPILTPKKGRKMNKHKKKLHNGKRKKVPSHFTYSISNKSSSSTSSLNPSPSSLFDESGFMSNVAKKAKKTEFETPPYLPVTVGNNESWYSPLQPPQLNSNGHNNRKQ